MLSHICPDRQDGDKSQEYRNQIHKVLMHNILKWLQKQWITKSPKSKVWQMNMSKLATKSCTEEYMKLSNLVTTSI